MDYVKVNGKDAVTLFAKYDIVKDDFVVGVGRH
jgi:hypothetical protein